MEPEKHLFAWIRGSSRYNWYRRIELFTITMIKYSLVLLLVFSVAACDVALKSQLLNEGTPDDSLSVQICFDLGDLVDRELGNDCLNELAFDLNDARYCRLIEENAEKEEGCLRSLE